jgi:hypothetical protein
MIITTIEDKNVFGQTINAILTNVLSYDLGRDDCKLRYELRFRDPNRPSDAEPDTIINSGVWQVPQSVLDSWTGSNIHLVEKLCQAFDLVPIEHTNY